MRSYVSVCERSTQLRDANASDSLRRRSRETPSIGATLFHCRRYNQCRQSHLRHVLAGLIGSIRILEIYGRLPLFSFGPVPMAVCGCTQANKLQMNSACVDSNLPAIRGRDCTPDTLVSRPFATWWGSMRGVQDVSLLKTAYDPHDLRSGNSRAPHVRLWFSSAHAELHYTQLYRAVSVMQSALGAFFAGRGVPSIALDLRDECPCLRRDNH